MPIICLLLGVLLPTTQTAASAAWQADLGRLAAQIADSLTRPATPESNMDREGRRFWGDLSLASEWPHPLFRQPLLQLVQSDDAEVAYRAALALLNYLDPDLRATLELLEVRLARHDLPVNSGDKMTLDFDFKTRDVVRTLEAIAQTYQGFDGVMHPSGFNKEVARQTADNWAKWIAENTPPPHD